jgi:hypothetical protein
MPRALVKPVSLAGRVTRAADGSPIAGATIALVGDQEPSIVTSNTDGLWTAQIVAERLTVTVAAPGFLPHARELETVAPDEQRTVDVALETGGTRVTGTISTQDHKSIANARVRASRGSETPVAFALSDANGRYDLSLPPGHYQLEVTHDNYQRTSRYVRVDDEPAGADFVLAHGGVIRGQVVAGDTGEPVANATVQATGDRDFVSARSNDDGTFELRGLADGTVTVHARGPGYASVSPTLVELGLGEHMDDVDVTVDPAFNIAGRVVSASEPTQGVAGAKVLAMPSRGLLIKAVSDTDGYFELAGTLAGHYTLFVEKRGMLSESGVEVDVVDNDVMDVTIAMRHGRTISGRVAPPMVARIWISRSGAEPLIDDANDAFRIFRARTESDATGAFTLRGVPAGDFEVRAMASDGRSGMQPVSATTADLTNLLIQLTPRTSVSGRIVDTNGKPVAAIRVSAERVDVPMAVLLREAGIPRGATTTPDGAFKIVGLDPGVWSLSAIEPKGGGTDAAKLEVDLSDGGDRTGITMTIEARDAVIRGTVRGADGKPASGAKVGALREVGGEQQFDAREPVRTDDTGSFVLDKLRPGTYAVVADGRGGKTVVSGIHTGTTANIVLAPLSSLVIVVTHGGTPANKVRVFCSGPTVGVGLDEVIDGSRTFTDVVQGEYRCEATSDAGTARASIIVGAERAKLTLPLEGYGALAGTAVDVLTGQPVAKLQLMAQDARAETDASGRFVLERVPAGPGELLSTPKDQEDVGWDAHAYTARPGQRVELGPIKVVAPRVGDVGTFGLALQVRDNTVLVTKVKPGGPAERAGITVGASIATIKGQPVSAIGVERVKRLLTSELVGVGQTLTLVLDDGKSATMTAVRW